MSAPLVEIADTDHGVRPGVTTIESAELRELRKPNKLLEQENQILRRAAVIMPAWSWVRTALSMWW